MVEERSTKWQRRMTRLIWVYLGPSEPE